MGGFTSIVPIAASVLQAGQRIEANRANTQNQIARNEAARQAELADIAAQQKQEDAERADTLRRQQAAIRARQGASGLIAGGSGSASAVLAGYEKAALKDQEADQEYTGTELLIYWPAAGEEGSIKNVNDMPPLTLPGKSRSQHVRRFKIYGKMFMQGCHV